MAKAAPRLLVFGGIYGNLQAFRAFLATAANKENAQLVFTGDLVAYCADGDDVCKLLQKTPLAAAIRGNCERAIAAGDDGCGCGFAPGSACDLLSRAWHAHALRSISSQSKAWMGALPERRIIRFGGRQIAVLHASLESDDEFIFPSTPAARKRDALDALGVDGVIAGHSGIPFTQEIDGKVWHNSGALGMPANDGTPRVWFSEWTASASGDIRIAHRALEYETADAQRAMEIAGLPPGYREALQSGIWPSDSILPPEERSRQGKFLDPPDMFWPGAGIPVRAPATASEAGIISAETRP